MGIALIPKSGEMAKSHMVLTRTRLFRKMMAGSRLILPLQLLVDRSHQLEIHGGSTLVNQLANSRTRSQNSIRKRSVETSYRLRIRNTCLSKRLDAYVLVYFLYYFFRSLFKTYTLVFSSTPYEASQCSSRATC